MLAASFPEPGERRAPLPSNLKQWLRHVLDMDVADIASLPALKRHTMHLLRFIHRAGSRFIEDKCIQRASALAYASLLAIVPLVALGFSIFTSFHAFDVLTDKVRDMLLHYLLPTSQDVVQRYLVSITGKATALSVFGILGLLVTATALLNTTEEAFNHIWRISHTRSWLSKFTTFWATFTLAPALVAASITITSYFTALPILRDVSAHAGLIPFLIPWTMSSVALTTLYMVLPNIRIPFRPALVGGLVAGALFELSKFGFAFYVTKLAHYEKLYGALGALPVFLIWLYLTWVVVLFGAEIVYCLQHPRAGRRQRDPFLRPGVPQFFAHIILVRAAQALERGRTLNMDSLMTETGAPDHLIQAWLDQLCEKKLLRHTSQHDTDQWALEVDAHRLHLNDIHAALNHESMHIPAAWRDSPLATMLAGLYFRLERERSTLLENVSLTDLAQSEEEST